MECRILCDLWIREIQKFVEIGLNFRFEFLIFEKKINFGRREEMMWGREREREKGGGKDFAARKKRPWPTKTNPALGLASARAGPAVCLTIQ